MFDRPIIWLVTDTERKNPVVLSVHRHPNHGLFSLHTFYLGVVHRDVDTSAMHLLRADSNGSGYNPFGGVPAADSNQNGRISVRVVQRAHTALLDSKSTQQVDSCHGLHIDGQTSME